MTTPDPISNSKEEICECDHYGYHHQDDGECTCGNCPCTEFKPKERTGDAQVTEPYQPVPSGGKVRLQPAATLDQQIERSFFPNKYVADESNPETRHCQGEAEIFRGTDARRVFQDTSKETFSRSADIEASHSVGAGMELLPTPLAAIETDVSDVTCLHHTDFERLARVGCPICLERKSQQLLELVKSHQLRANQYRDMAEEANAMSVVNFRLTDKVKELETSLAFWKSEDEKHILEIVSLIAKIKELKSKLTNYDENPDSDPSTINTN